MNELLEWLECIEDISQERKIKHKLKYIILKLPTPLRCNEH